MYIYNARDLVVGISIRISSRYVYARCITSQSFFNFLGLHSTQNLNLRNCGCFSAFAMLRVSLPLFERMKPATTAHSLPHVFYPKLEIVRCSATKCNCYQISLGKDNLTLRHRRGHHEGTLGRKTALIACFSQLSDPPPLALSFAHS